MIDAARPAERSRILPRLRPIGPSAPPSLEALEHGRLLAADAVLRYGEVYLPIFERLDSEVETLRRKTALLARVEQVAAAGRATGPTTGLGG